MRCARVLDGLDASYHSHHDGKMTRYVCVYFALISAFHEVEVHRGEQYVVIAPGNTETFKRYWFPLIFQSVGL